MGDNLGTLERGVCHFDMEGGWRGSDGKGDNGTSRVGGRIGTTQNGKGSTKWLPSRTGIQER